VPLYEPVHYSATEGRWPPVQCGTQPVRGETWSQTDFLPHVTCPECLVALAWSPGMSVARVHELARTQLAEWEAAYARLYGGA